MPTISLTMPVISKVGPLDLPEIVAIILKYVDSKTLVAAAQVNSLWAEEATRI